MVVHGEAQVAAVNEFHAKGRMYMHDEVACGSSQCTLSGAG
jgi:hypothetical protein